MTTVRKEPVYIGELVWKAGLWLVENMLTWRGRQSIFRYADSAYFQMCWVSNHNLYFGMKCDNRHVTAAWTQSLVTRRQPCGSDTVLWHGMKCDITIVWYVIGLKYVEAAMTSAYMLRQQCIHWPSSVFRKRYVSKICDSTHWPMAYTLGLGPELGLELGPGLGLGLELGLELRL